MWGVASSTFSAAEPVGRLFASSTKMGLKRASFVRAGEPGSSRLAGYGPRVFRGGIGVCDEN